MVGDGCFFNGKVAFKHAAIGAKLFDGVHVVWGVGTYDVVGSGRAFGSVPAKAVDWHGNASKFGDNVGALAEGCNGLFPLGKYFIPVACIGADAQGAAEVVEDDGGVGEGTGKFGDFRDLGVVAPDLKAEVKGREAGKAFSEGRLAIQVVILRIPHMKIYAQVQLAMLKLFKLLIMLMLLVLISF